ncbi:COX15/CtaA family protein [Minwuia thermotolerans]|uniref:Heme A synthase n=1 Tax=Minwuia thermotolerans TaxID=2056226 RepID=A0A2M9G5Q7_9PROT|nr:COX15/CtaA family protein [Minwuia thermotolerans]PJK31048.1 heme A synthase [Minwuia thermotolerans]
MSTIIDSGAGVRADRDQRAVVLWLYAVAALVFVMIVVGGITRLTESGLSMVEWRPVTGWLPPLSEAAWQAEFEKYKAFPEYQKVNAGMSLADFKTIYAWEFAHRLLGRIIGLAFFAPLVFFLATGRIRRSQAPWFIFLLLAGGSQGALGWYMVQSGLIDNPDVSQYRLAAHLFLAFAIYALLIWTAWALRGRGAAPPAVTAGFRTAATVFGVLAAVQIVIGAFVAGTNAGFAYSTWPTMDGDLIPPYMFDTSPWWLAAFEDVTTIQFLHRTVGYLIAAAAVWLFFAGRRIGRPARSAATAALHLVLIQIVLGIATLLMVVPVWLGALHQAMAVLVWTAAVYALRMGWTGRRPA